MKKPPFICQYCGAGSWYEPADQTPPVDYCHESDHGDPDNCPDEDSDESCTS